MVEVDMRMILDENEVQTHKAAAAAAAADADADASLFELEIFKSLSVLLVDFDDSTRSIITALLSKTGYRVVSVPDGLKAWETLKGKPHSIDLVLAEVELPSISGFSLLTMIMEDEICRNIPVIMMSSYDAVNIVYKCMLRGAADFLVKPVRKNELRNLWQHVWRRHSVSNRTLSQQKSESLEENSSSKHSTYDVGSPKENSACHEKESKAQSSCAKLDMEDNNINMQPLSQQNSSTASIVNVTRPSNDGDISIQLNSELVPCNQSSHSVVLITEEEHTFARMVSENKGLAPETQSEDSNVHVYTSYGNDEKLKPSRETMDLIGSFDDNLHVYNSSQELPHNNSNIYLHPNSRRDNCSSNPQLELSLRRSHVSDTEIQGVADAQTLKHSTISAFSRYDQRNLQAPVCTESEVCASFSNKNQPDHAVRHTAEVAQQGIISVPIPVRSTGIDGFNSENYAVWLQLLCTRLGPLQPQSPNIVAQQEANFHVNSSEQSIAKMDDYQQYNCKSTDAAMYAKHHKVESFDDQSHFSAATAQSVSSSLCNSSSSNLSSSGCGSVCDGSNGYETAVTTVRTSTGCGNDTTAVFLRDGHNGTDSRCLTQREAALSKFRLKRKDRCFDKKVRYQSRKRLAEQRLRVKGQFVRQISS